jgi:hypothetical protein
MSSPVGRMNVPGKFRLIMEEDRLRKELAKEEQRSRKQEQNKRKEESAMEDDISPEVAKESADFLGNALSNSTEPAADKSAAVAVDVCVHERTKEKLVKPKERMKAWHLI